jgi:hypothetical protein
MFLLVFVGMGFAAYLYQLPQRFERHRYES